MKTKTAIIVALLVVISCIASLAPSASAQCDHFVEVDSYICYEDTNTPGWFFNGTAWNYEAVNPTALFKLYDYTDGVYYNGFCIDYEVGIQEGDTFNASVFTAEPSCKNNSIAYLLNHWAFDDTHCTNVAAGQSAVWYFTYLDETFCASGTPQFNHTAIPPFESRWIPDATHSLARTMINDSINQSEPYELTLDPVSGTYNEGTPVPLTATVGYCLGSVGEEVTVEFKTDKGHFNENNMSTYAHVTTNGKLTATLICSTAGTAHVTAKIINRYWFEVVDPLVCDEIYQPTLRIINLTSAAAFNFEEITTGCLEGYVYQDRSCNCTFEPNYPEPGVYGVQVCVYNATAQVACTTTDTNGFYKICNLPTGVYTVKYNESTLPAPFIPKCDDIVDYTKPTEGTETVPANGVATHNFAVKVPTGVSIEKKINGVEIYEAEQNETVEITLNITNTGKVPLTNLSVHDAFPDKQPNAGLTWTGSATPIALPLSSIHPGNWIHFTLDWGYPYNDVLTGFEPLDPGESFIITFTATVDPQACGLLRDVAYVTASHEWCTSPCVAQDDAWVDVKCEKFPVMTPIGIVALVGLLGLVIIVSTRKRKEKRGE